jgi:hypothetical protein
MSSRRLSRALSTETDVTIAPATGEDCVICLSTISDDCVCTPCNHHFHQGCLDQYLLTHGCHEECDQLYRRARCPICRGSLRFPLAVEARSTSDRRIEVVDIPCVGGHCHFDRGYTFTSLGSFQRPGMLYVQTSNDDRRTPASNVMWVVESQVRVAVHLNFRSEKHVSTTGVESWLRAHGWQRNRNLKSTVSTGYPNGPYSGPVYSKECESGTIELMGSNAWEGVYFVFIEQRELLRQTPPLQRDVVDTSAIEVLAETGITEESTEAGITDELASIPPLLGPSVGPISRPRNDDGVAAPRLAAGTSSPDVTQNHDGPRRQPLAVRRLIRSVTAPSVNGESSAMSRPCPRRIDGAASGVGHEHPTARADAVEEARVQVAWRPVMSSQFVHSPGRVRASARTDVVAANAGDNAQPPAAAPGSHAQVSAPSMQPVENLASRVRRAMTPWHSEGNSSGPTRPRVEWSLTNLRPTLFRERFFSPHGER